MTEIQKITEKDPLVVFKEWFELAKNSKISQPEAMTLATASALGIPSARIVLLKDVSQKENSFQFYTNYESKKSLELLENPQACLVFFWETLGKQIRIQGTVRKVSRQDSVHYFATRARESQIGAWASKQSRAIDQYSNLEDQFKSYESKFKDQPIPCPEHWGGFSLSAKQIEFWQAKPYRLHLRTQYTLEGQNQWKIETLAP
jgi:pyridoxamine 5'-phosphate oxidase